MYDYVSKKEYKSCSKNLWPLIRKVQMKLKSKMTINPLLIGSTKYRLVTRNSENNPFDFDFNFVVRCHDKSEDPKDIRESIFNSLQEILKNDKYFEMPLNGSKTIKIQHKRGDKIYFQIEIAICIEKGTTTQVVKLMKKENPKLGESPYLYTWNKEDEIATKLKRDFTIIRKNGKWLEFKKRYLELKNMHLKMGEKRKSISVYMETINEFKQ